MKVAWSAVVRWSLAICMIAATFLPVAGFTKHFEHGEIATWFVREYYERDTGEFSRCTVESSYLSGVFLTFVTNTDYQYEFWISHDDWSLTEGDRHIVKMVVDDERIVFATANVLTEWELDVPIFNQQYFYNEIVSGDVLAVEANGQTFNFELYGMHTAMKAARTCVEDALAYQQRRADGNAEINLTRTNSPDQPASQTFLHEFVGAMIANDNFGMAGMEIYEDQPEHLSQKDYDIAWKDDDLEAIGTELVREGIHLGTVAEAVNAEYENRCLGTFHSEMLIGKQVPGALFTRTIFMQCDSEHDAFNAVYTLLPAGEALFELTHIAKEATFRPVEADRILVDAMIDYFEELHLNQD